MSKDEESACAGRIPAAMEDASDHAVVKLLKLLDSGMPEPGTFGGIAIVHGEGCPRPQGAGLCRCDPDLQLLPPAPQESRAHERRRSHWRRSSPRMARH